MTADDLPCAPSRERHSLVQPLTARTITLDGPECRALGRLAAEAAARHGEVDPAREDVLEEAELLGCRLPDRLLRALSRVRSFGVPGGGLLIRSLPVDRPLPSTPGRPGGFPARPRLPVSTLVQLAVSSRLGDPIGFADEKDGALVQDVLPLAGHESRQENSGSFFLKLHTEDGFHPHRPDFVTLLGLRPDHDGEALTLLVGLEELLPVLSPSCLASLREPWFRIRVSSSFTDGSRELMSRPLRVLSDDDTVLTLDLHAMEALTPAAEAALGEVRRVVSSRIRGTVLRTGDLIVIDNRSAVHGRTTFRARYDGHDRWLRRVFIASDLRRSAPDRPVGSRVCRPLGTLGAGITHDGGREGSSWPR